MTSFHAAAQSTRNTPPWIGPIGQAVVPRMAKWTSQLSASAIVGAGRPIDGGAAVQGVEQRPRIGDAVGVPIQPQQTAEAAVALEEALARPPALKLAAVAALPPRGRRRA